MRENAIFRLMAVAFIFHSASCFDLPTQYRAPLFMQDVTRKVKDWTTEVWVRVGTGSTYDSFNSHEDKTALFNANDPFNLVRLGINLDSIDPTTQPVTDRYWGQNGPFTSTALANANIESPDGTAIFGGRFRASEFDLCIQQNLFWGFYVHLFLPYKDYHIDRIATKLLGSQTVNNVNMNMFINVDLPQILTENGLKKYTAPFKKSTFSDGSFSVGWHGYLPCQTGMVSSLGGLLQIGAIMPIAPNTDTNTVFAIPLGYDDQPGVVGRMAAEAGLWEMFKLGAHFGSLMFFKKNKTVRLKTDKEQNGWIILQESYGGVDWGSLWDIGAYFKIDQFAKGLSFIVGYSYVKQEKTKINVKDDEYLKTLQGSVFSPFDQNTVVIATNAPNVQLISQDDYANSDKRLSGWDTQSLHFVASYDMSYAIKGGWGPLFKFEYSYPITGKQSWATSFMAGSLGFTVCLPL